MPRKNYIDKRKYKNRRDEEERKRRKTICRLKKELKKAKKEN